MSAEPCPASVRDLLPEAALGLLAEPERGEVLAHVETCAACRRALDELVEVADHLVALAPEAEPPPGFEQRALARIGARRPRRRRATWVAVAAGALLLAAGVGLGLLASDDGPGTGIEQADLRTDDGDAVGTVLVTGGDDRAVVVRLDLYRPGITYACQVVLADGTVVDVGTWRPEAATGPDWWTAALDAPGAIIGARVLGADGTVFADAQLG